MVDVDVKTKTPQTKINALAEAEHFYSNNEKIKALHYFKQVPRVDLRWEHLYQMGRCYAANHEHAYAVDAYTEALERLGRQGDELDIYAWRAKSYRALHLVLAPKKANAKKEANGALAAQMDETYVHNSLYQQKLCRERMTIIENSNEHSMETSSCHFSCECYDCRNR